MHVRCPHCHQPVERVDNTEAEHIDCPSCGRVLVGSVAARVDSEQRPGAQRIAASAEAPTIAPVTEIAEAKTLAHNGAAALTAQVVESRDFGDYELLAEIARGGMGVVFKARQKRLNRTVAVKMILAGQLADQDEVRRFMTEAEAAAGLDHPGIVPVYESGEIGGQHFFSMGYIDGQSLAALLAAVPLPSRRAAQLVAEVADAVDYAHERGVIHRDLKPGNILLDQDGHPRVTDFGLAKRVAGDSGLTRTGQALGTPSYMPPEQASGKLDAIGRPADIYALGAVLYAALTGRPPFQAATPIDTILQVLEQDPVAPRQLNAEVPRDLETIALKCLQKEPNKRYATANELAEELRRFLRGEPIHARPVSRPERTWRWCKRKPVVAAVSAVAVLLLVATAGVSTVAYLREAALGRELAKRGDQLQEKTIAVTKALEDEQRAERRQHEEQLAAAIAEARAKRYSGQAGQRFDTVDAVRGAAELARRLGEPAAVFDELRNLAVAALALPDLRESAKTWDGWPEGTFAVAFDSAALRFYARGDQQGNVTVRHLEDDDELASLAGTGAARHLLVGADGKTLLLHDSKTGLLERWTIGEAAPAKVAMMTPDVCYWQQSGDGRRLLVVHPSPVCSLEVIEIPSGRRAFEFRSATSLVPHDAAKRAALSRDGRWLAYVDGLYLAPPHSQVMVFDVDSGKVAMNLSHQENVISPVWHPDNRTLAVGGVQSDDVYLWDAPATKLINTLRDQKGGEPTLAMSASGQLLTSVSDWSGSQVFWHPHSGRVLLRTPLRYGLKSVVQDGRQFEYSVDKPRITLRVAEPSPVFRILTPDPAGPHSDHARSVSPHPRASILAFGHRFGVSLFDLRSGMVLGQVDLGPTQQVGYDVARFDPSNGDLLTYGPLGLYRWPVRFKGDARRSIIVGPERLVGTWTRGFGFDISRDGGMIAVADAGSAAVLHTGDGAQTVLRPLVDCRDVQISPDGRWIIASSPAAANGSVWNVQTGQEAAKIEGASGLFSPDGAWLWSNRTRYRAGSWEKAPPLAVAEGPAPIAFSPDGAFFVGAVGDTAVALVDAVTGTTLVELSPPVRSRCENAAFSCDGSQLLLQSVDLVSVFAWDLRALRRHLADLGLDWDAPPPPPAADEEYLPPPVLAVESVQTIERVLENQVASRQWSAAAASLKKLVECKPSEHMPWFQLALVSVFLDDEKTLADATAHIAKRFADTTDPFIQERFTKAFVLAQEILPETTIPEAWLQSVHADPSPPGLEPWNPLAAALVDLRRNQPAEALPRLRQALGVSHDLFNHWRISYGIGSLTASCHFARSLAFSAQENQPTARDAYIQGLSVYWTQMPHLPTDPMYPSGFWQEYMVSRVLCRRAEERLFGREQTEVERYRLLAQARAASGENAGLPIRHPNELLKPTDVVGSWGVYVHPDARHTIYPTAGAIVFQVDSGGGADWHVQAFQHGLDLKEGGEYVARFQARASKPRGVMLRAGIDHDDYHSVGLDQNISLNDHFESFELKFRARDVAPHQNRFGFMLGGEDGAVFVKEMSLIETAFDAQRPQVRNPRDALKPPMAASSWGVYVDQGARASHHADDGAMVFEVVSTSDAQGSVHAFQIGLDLREGRDYVLRFQARADAPRGARLVAQIDHDDRHSIGLDRQISLGEEFESFEFKFRAHDVAPNSNAFVFLLGVETGTVFVKNMSLVETASSERHR